MADVYVRQDGLVPLYHPRTGEEALVPLDEARKLVLAGYRGKDPETARKEIIEKHYGGTSGALKTAALGAAGMVTLGASTLAARKAGVDVDLYQEANPDALSLGRFGGGIASLVAGPLALAGKGAAAAGTALGARIAAAGLGRGALAAGAARLGGAAIGAGVRGAGLGGASAAAETADELASGRDVTLGDAMKAIGAGMAYGATFDVLGAGIAGGVRAGARAAAKVAGGGALSAEAKRAAMAAAHREAHDISQRLITLREQEAVLGRIGARNSKIAELMRHSEAKAIDPATRAAAFDRLIKAAGSPKEAAKIVKLRDAAELDSRIYLALEKSRPIEQLIKAAATSADDAAILRAQISGVSAKARKDIGVRLRAAIAADPEAAALSKSTLERPAALQSRIARSLDEWAAVRGRVKDATGRDIGATPGKLGDLTEAIGGGVASEVGWKLGGFAGKVIARSEAVRAFARGAVKVMAGAAPAAGRGLGMTVAALGAEADYRTARERRGLNPTYSAKLDRTRMLISEVLASGEAAGGLPVPQADALRAQQEALEDAAAADTLARYRHGLAAVEAAPEHPAGLMVALSAGPGVLRATYQAAAAPVLNAASRGVRAPGMTHATAADAMAAAVDGRGGRGSTLMLSGTDAATIAKQLERIEAANETLAVRVAGRPGMPEDAMTRAADEVQRGVQYLQTIAPKRPEGYAGPWQPDFAQAARFSRGLAVAVRPQAAMDALASRELRQEHVDALRAVHPDIYARAASVAADVLEHDGDTLGAVTRDQLRMFVGDTRPSALPILPATSGRQAPGAPVRGRSLDVATHARTQLDALLSGRA